LRRIETHSRPIEGCDAPSSQESYPNRLTAPNADRQYYQEVEDSSKEEQSVALWFFNMQAGSSEEWWMTRGQGILKVKFE